MTKTKVIGMNELTKDLDAFVKDISDKEVKSIVENNAVEVATAMKSLVRENTGRLKNSIGVISESKFPTSVIVGPRFIKDRAGTLTIPALAAINEYGAGPGKPSEENKKGYIRFKVDGNWVTLKKRGPISAQAFIRPAYDMTRNQVRESLIEDLTKLIDQKAKKNNLK